MRLPTPADFESAAHKTTKKDSWNKYSAHYWTSGDSEGNFLGVYCIKNTIRFEMELCKKT